MSSRQVARAAVHGHNIRFVFNNNIEPITGYVVGQDDFHWLIAHSDGANFKTTLVHKGSAALLTISPSSTLLNEEADFRTYVEKIGRGFWLWCDETYFASRNIDPASTTSLETAS